MKKIFLLLFCLLLASPSWAAVYYVSVADGDDGNTGLSQTPGATGPWQTIAKVNASSFAAGDFIYFKRGETWRETLTVPSSGSAGNVITFGAYGAGADPILSGANLLKDVVSVAWQTALSIAQSGDASAGARNYRFTIAAGTSSYSGSKVRITCNAGAGGSATLSGSSIGLMTAVDDFDAAPTRITWDGGADTATINANQAKVSDEITFTFTKTSVYGLHLYFANKLHIMGVGAANTLYYNTTAVDDTLTQTVAYTPTSGWNCLSKIEVYSDNSVLWTLQGGTTYSYSLAANPQMVSYNGTILAYNAGAFAALGSNEWDYNGTTLYVDVGEDPNIGSLEAGIRSTVITTVGKNYVTIQDLNICGPSTSRGIYNSSGGALGVIIQRCSIKNFKQSGIQFNTADGNNMTVTVANCAFLDAGVYMLPFYGGAVATGNTLSVTDNTFVTSFFDGTGLKGYDDYTNLQAIHTDNVAAGGLNILRNTITFPDGLIMGLYGSSDTVYIKDSPGAIVRNNVIRQGMHGFHFNGSVASTEFSHNAIWDSGDDCLWTDGSSGAGFTVAYNIFSGSADDCIQLATSAGTSNVLIANNILAFSRGMGLLLGTDNTGGVTVKNNIFFQNGQPGDPHTGVTPEGCEFRIDNITGVVIDNNVYYHTTAKQTTNPWKWGVGGQYIWADYLAANGGQETHSFNIDPLFVDSTHGTGNGDSYGNDFHLTKTSPCINTATPVGLTSDYAGNPVGGQPDIGAYEFPIAGRPTGVSIW